MFTYTAVFKCLINNTARYSEKVKGKSVGRRAPALYSNRDASLMPIRKRKPNTHTNSKLSLATSTKKSKKGEFTEWGPTPIIESVPSTPSVYHGISRMDPYAWLEDRQSPKVKHVLQRENAYVDGFFRQRYPTLRKELFQEIKHRWKENESSVPSIDGPYWYYARHVPNAEYPIFCRRPYDEAKGINTNFIDELSSFWRDHPFADLPHFEDEEVYMDPNLLQLELRVDALEIGDIELSPDHSQVAVQVDLTNGQEVYTLFILDIQDVSFQDWLDNKAPPAVTRAARELAQSDESIYEVLDHTGSPQGSPVSPGSNKSLRGTTAAVKITHSSTTGSSIHGSSFPPFPAGEGTSPSPSPSLLSAKSSSNKRDASSTEGVSSKSKARTTPTAGNWQVQPPRHQIRHRIDQFAMGPEVMWLSPTSVLYFGLDEAMRPYQLVYHDLLTRPDDNPLATVVCYEENDEAFFLGSLCTSADRRYFMFDTSATSMSEWYVCPMTPMVPPPATRTTMTMTENHHGKQEKAKEEEKLLLLPQVHAVSSTSSLSSPLFPSHWMEKETQLLAVPMVIPPQTGEGSAGSASGETACWWDQEESLKGRDVMPLCCVHQRATIDSEQRHHYRKTSTTLPPTTIPCARMDMDPPNPLKEEDPNGAAVEYDVDHHEQLLGHTEGGWIVRSNRGGRLNFALWCIPDVAATKTTPGAASAIQSEACANALVPAEAVNNPESQHTPRILTGLAESVFADWIPLFAYDPSVKVDGMDCVRDFVILSVRRCGVATALFCPMCLVWQWWTQNKGKPRPEVKPMLLDQLIDLSSLLRPVWERRQSTTFKEQADSGGASEDVLAVLDLSSYNGTSSHSSATTGNVDSMGEEGHRLCSSGSVPAVVPLVATSYHNPVNKDGKPELAALQTSSLPLTVECYTEGTSFECRRCRVTLSHFLQPLEQYELTYLPPHLSSSSPRQDGEPSSGMTGTLAVRFIKQEVVKGTYHRENYDGMVVWVPSDYCAKAVHDERQGDESISDDPPSESHVPTVNLIPTEKTSPPAMVPVYLLWRADLYCPGENPLLLNVYGSYGDCNEMDFSSDRLSLMDRGFMWGMTAVRGGGEFGTAWRDEGRQLQRGTTVNDFMSVAQFLQDRGLCAPGKLVSCGQSAGGFVVCRAMNAAPHLFHAVIGTAPFVDCLATLLRADLPLTVTEWEEFGNPIEDPVAYRLIAALSPVDTVPPAEQTHLVMPHLLLNTSWNDTRVSYWESLKLTAHLRARMAAVEETPQSKNARTDPEAQSPSSSSSSSIVLHRCAFDTGHSGASGRYAQLHEIAEEYAFAILIVSSLNYFEQRQYKPYALPTPPAKKTAV